MSKRFICILLVLVIGMCFVGCSCEHEWKVATCTTPKTCSLCGEVEGVELGHNWNEATCEVPKTCERCAITEGEPLEHIEGNWKTYSTNMVLATVTSKKSCTECGCELDKQTVSMQQLHDTKKFLFTPTEFVDRFDMKLDEIANNSLEAYSGSAKEEFVCGVYDGDDRVGILLLAGEDGTVTTDKKNDVGFSSVLGTVNGADNYVNMVIALILTVDPTLDFSDAKEIGLELTESGDCTKNQITYSVLFNNKDVIITLAIDE